MKKLESSLFNMVAVLVVVALVMGGLLAIVNHVTEGPIQEQANKALADGIKAVLGSDNLNVTANDTIRKEFDGKEQVFIVHKAADASGKDLGAAVESTTMGFGGDLKVLVDSILLAKSWGIRFWLMPRHPVWAQKPTSGSRKTGRPASSASIPPHLSLSPRMGDRWMPSRPLPSPRGLSSRRSTKPMKCM